MKNLSMFRFLSISCALAMVVSSCSKEDVKNNAPVLETRTLSNLAAPQTGGQGQPVGGAFAKFSFSQNTTVTDDSWDIAFRGTTIIVNGGGLIGITDEPQRTGIGAVSTLTNTFDAVTAVPEASTFRQDGASTYAILTGSGNGWYNYISSTNLVTPIAGRIFVVKTHDGKYAKMEIISYYQNAPTNPDATVHVGRYFTFRYVYQANGTTF